MVSGLVKAKNIVVSGTLEGKVACETIDILATGKLLGEVVCGQMMIESGGKFIGESRELTEGGLIVSFPEETQTTLEDQRGATESIESDETAADESNLSSTSDEKSSSSK